MTTEFNDRAAHDRPLNDRFSDVRDDARDDDARDDDARDDDARDDVRDDGREDGPEFQEPRADEKAVINDDEPTFEETRSRDDSTLDGSRDHDDSTLDGSRDLDDESRVDEAQERVVPQQENRTHLFEEQEAERFRAQWRELQARFVDEPGTAVRDADSLLTSMMDELKSHIDTQKRSLDGEWDRDTKDTEELRVAMQRYRSLFDQILSV